MSRNVLPALALTIFSAATLVAADPFVGAWKFNVGKTGDDVFPDSSVFNQQYKIEDLGQNRYKLTSRENSDTFVADGKDHPFHNNNDTVSISKQSGTVWKLVRKEEGKTTVTATGMLSRNGSTLTWRVSEQDPDGTKSNYSVVMNRVGSGAVFEGRWKSTDLVLSPWQGGGLTFYKPASNYTLHIRFDGKDWPGTDGHHASGVSSGKRLNRNTLEITNTEESGVVHITTYKVSSDGKEMTLTWHDKGQRYVFISVYDKR